MKIEIPWLGIAIDWLAFVGVLVLLWLRPFIPHDLRRRLTDPTRLSFPTFRGMVRVWSNWLDLLRGAAGAYLLANLVFFAGSGEAGKPGEERKPNVMPASATNEAGDTSNTNATPASVASEAGGGSGTNAMFPKFVVLHDDAGRMTNASSADHASDGDKTRDRDRAKAPSLKIALLQFAVLGVGLLLQTIRLRRHVTFFAPTFYVCGITLAHSDLVIGVAAVAVGWLIALAAKSPIYQMPVMVAALGVAGFLLGSFSLLMFAGVVFLPIMVGLLWQKRLVYVSHGRSAAHKG